MQVELNCICTYIFLRSNHDSFLQIFSLFYPDVNEGSGARSQNHEVAASVNGGDLESEAEEVGITSGTSIYYVSTF